METTISPSPNTQNQIQPSQLATQSPSNPPQIKRVIHGFDINTLKGDNIAYDNDPDIIKIRIRALFFLM